MKKLMIAAAIVCAAAMSQAAALNWSQSTGTLQPGTTPAPVANGLNVYLIQTSAHGQDAFITALSQTASLDAFASTVDSWKAAASTVTGGGMGTFAIKDPSTTATSAFTAGANEYAYYAIIDTANERVFMSLSQKATYDGVYGQGAGEYTFAFSEESAYASMNGPFDAGAGNKGAGWYTAAVPEPTSGLLLLLGVAGLALKRKRA